MFAWMVGKRRLVFVVSVVLSALLGAVGHGKGGCGYGFWDGP
jgi:hypothetical protein